MDVDGVPSRSPLGATSHRLISTQEDNKTLTHAYVCETHKAAEVLGINEESLFLLQCMHGNDDEPGHELAYAAQSPYTKFKSAILDLEGQVAAIGNANDFPDVLSVLIGRVKGDERVSFTPAMDTFWGSYIGRDAGLKSPKGQATRAYALTILEAYQRFQKDGPERGMSDALKAKVMAARMPSASVAQLRKAAGY